MSWMGTIFNFLAGGQYESSPSAVSPGSTRPLLIDKYGRLVVTPQGTGTTVSTGASSTYATTAASASGVVKASTGSLYMLLGSNEGASKRWLMVFDATALPGNGANPKASFPVEAGCPFSLDLPRSWPFTSGIVWAISSTAHTLTYDSGASFAVYGEYV